MLYIPQNIPVGSTIVFCFILVVLQQSVYGLNWEDDGSGSKWQLNCDFSGHDVEKISSTGEICGSLCIASSNCTHFRYASDGFCYLKNAPPSILPTVTAEGMCGYVEPGYKIDIISPIITCRCYAEITEFHLSGRDHWNVASNGVKWLPHCDFSVRDIGREPSSAELCGDICLKNLECNHFRHDGEFCHVKKAPLTTLRTAVNGGACGYIPSRDFPSPDLPKNRSPKNKLQFIFVFMATTMSVMKTTVKFHAV